MQKNFRYLILFPIIFAALIQWSSSAWSISKEEFEEYKNQDIHEYLDTGERMYQRRVGPPINKKYFRGSNLIYDCEKRHFACVIEDNFIECEKLKNLEEDNKQAQYTCVPLKKYTTQKECFKNQMRAVETVVDRSFCLKIRK